MKNIRRHLTYANVAATLALVVALSGSAYAANLITSRQIKNGTIQNADIHRNAIKSNKIHNGTIQTADLAPSAQEHEFEASLAGKSANLSSTPVLIKTLSISSPGTYFITAKTAVLNLDSVDAVVTCSLGSSGNLGTIQDDATSGLQPFSTGNVFTATFSMQVTQAFSGSSGSASVFCTANSAIATAVNSTVITALKVDLLN